MNHFIDSTDGERVSARPNDSVLFVYNLLGFSLFLWPNGCLRVRTTSLFLLFDVRLLSERLTLALFLSLYTSPFFVSDKFYGRCKNTLTHFLSDFFLFFLHRLLLLSVFPFSFRFRFQSPKYYVCNAITASVFFNLKKTKTVYFGTLSPHVITA